MRSSAQLRGVALEPMLPGGYLILTCTRYSDFLIYKMCFCRLHCDCSSSVALEAVVAGLSSPDDRYLSE